MISVVIWMPRAYDYLKIRGICVKCGKNKADTGYTTCLVCRMDIREKGETHKTESLYRHRQWLKRRRDIQYAFGVCVTCGKRDAEGGKSICKFCKAKAKSRAAKSRLKKGIFPRDSYTKDGECYFCKNDAMSSKKVCPKHYKILFENMKKARESKTEKGLFELRNEAFWREKKCKSHMRQETETETIY